MSTLDIGIAIPDTADELFASKELARRSKSA